MVSGHSHSILSTHRNALIYKRKIFLLTVKARPSSRQNFSLMISKENSRDSNFVWLRQLSPTIGRFFALSIAERILRQDEKRPSASVAQGARAGHVCALLITRTHHRPARASMRPRRARLGCSHPTSPWIPRQSCRVFDRWPTTMGETCQILHAIVLTMSKSFAIPTIYRDSSGCGVSRGTSPLESVRRIRNTLNQGRPPYPETRNLTI